MAMTFSLKIGTVQGETRELSLLVFEKFCGKVVSHTEEKVLGLGYMISGIVFAADALKQMSDAGIDMYCALPVLSTYVGHSSITATERYLRLTEEFYPDVSAKVMSATSKVYPEVYMVETN
jgi:hypothetical protein